MAEIKGVWITLDDSNVLKSEDGIRKALERLKLYGFNTIYPCVWHSGYTLYHSTVAETFMGSAVKPEFAGRNLMKELVKASKDFGFRLLPWFEFGLMVAPNSPIDSLETKDLSKYKDLITRTETGDKIRIKENDLGKLVPDDFVWMNPCHPEVRNFMIQLMAEMAEKYEVDGIQLDDHFGWPKELGYDQLAQDTYRKEKDGKDRETWASGKVTELIRQIFAVVKAKRSSCLISISPQPWQFSKDNFRLDWKTWEREGQAEELVLQNYVPANFTTELTKQEVKDSRTHIPTVIGIMAGQKDSPVSLSQMKLQLNETRAEGFAGVSFFFYETFFNELRSASGGMTIIPKDETQLKNLFD